MASLVVSALASASALAGAPEREFYAHSVFGSHMALQRGVPISISGVAAPGSRIDAEFASCKVSVEAGADGEWEAVFPKMDAGGPYFFKAVCGSKTIAFDDILVGDVWLCAGQSNMELPLDGGRFWRVANAVDETAAADCPNIRLFNTVEKRRVSPGVLRAEAEGSGWTRCTPATAKSFSAVGYFFGRQIQADLNVPVGLINVAWNGARIEPWISEDAYRKAGCKEMLDEIARAKLPEPARTESEEAAKEAYNATMADWRAKFRASEPALSAAAKKWKEPSFDDSSWESVQLPHSIMTPGVVWYRLSFDLPKEFDGKDLVFAMGGADDCDEAFFNGKKIGETDIDVYFYFLVKRVYPVLGKWVAKAGRNVIAVRVFNYYTSGGLVSPEPFLYVADDPSKRISLKDGWKSRVEFFYDFSKCGPRPYFDFPGMDSFFFPSTIFNGVVNPWLKFKIKGALWYQGCSNAGMKSYGPLLKLLLADWREKWREPSLPFVIAQLSAFQLHRPGNRLADDFWKTMPPEKDYEFAMIREIQSDMLKDPNVGVAVTIDVGDHSDIHPSDKRTVGFRMAKEAERVAYGSKEPSQGPRFESMKVEGDKIRVFFKSSAGLAVKGGGSKPGAFAIAGADGKFFWADAEIDGDSVLASSPEVKAPKSVRYAYVSYRGDIDLCDKNGFPAFPFRTDRPAPAE